MLFVEVPLHTPELFVNAPDQLHVTALNGTGHPPDGWNIINISYDPDAETPTNELSTDMSGLSNGFTPLNIP